MHKTGETVTVDFTTSNPTTGAAADADSLPTGTLVVNGTDNGATVTITNKATGSYKAAVTLPTVTDGDELQIRIAATVSSVAGKAVIWTGYGVATRPADVLSGVNSLLASTVVITSAVADGAPTTSSFATGLAGLFANDWFNDAILVFTSGALADHPGRPITDYVDSTGTVSFDEAFTSAPANGDTFNILANHIHPISQIQSGLATQASVDALPQTITVKKNAALSGFPFVMVSSSNHVTPTAGLTVTATRSIDGAAFAACANAVVEVASGAYKINLAAADLNGDTILLRFTATGADDVFVTIVTQP